MAKIKPTPLTLHYYLETSVDANQTHFYYFDLWQHISAVSRRFNRQGQDLAISGIRFMSSHTAAISVARLPPTWITYEAWESSFRAWQRLDRIAQESNPDSLMNAKYRDFKVFMDNIHASAASQSEVSTPVPVGVAAGIGNASAAYEWDYSRIQFPEDTGLTTQQLHMLGANSTSGTQTLGVIHNYALARERPMSSDPNVPVSSLGAFGDSYLNTMFDFGDSFDDVIAASIEENNEPPYPVGLWPEDAAGNQTGEFYPGGANYMNSASAHEIASTSIYNNQASTLKANGFVGGFVAPLGLIQMELLNPTDSTNSYLIDVYIDLLPGPSHGVMGRSMLEGN